MTSSHDPTAVGAEIERLIHRLDALGESAVKTEAQELVRLLLSLYGSGLSRILDIVRTEQGGPRAVLDRLGADSLVASLLVLHDIHPDPVDARVTRALAGLEPHLPAHTNLRLVGIEGDSVRVRVESAAPAGHASGIRASIERAVQEAAPEIGTVDVEGLSAPPGALIQIIRRSPDAPMRSE